MEAFQNGLTSVNPMSERPENEQAIDLVRRARAGSRSAIPAMIRAFDAILRDMLWGGQFGLMRRYDHRCSDSDNVEDALGEAWRDLDQFRGDTQEELSGWLREILERNFRDRMRSLHRAKRDIRREQSLSATGDHGENSAAKVAAPSASPLGELVYRDDIKELESRLHMLPPIVAAALRAWSDGASWDAIGRHLGCTRAAARQTFRRAILKLRRLNN
jgi:RNA polymerase sigma-70 factor (ECF subfamily)